MASVIMWILYIPLGLLQILAFAAGLNVWLGIPGGVGLAIAFFIGPIPILGTILGMVGAHSAWGWSWLASFLLFFGPIVLLWVLVLVEETLTAVFSRMFRQ